MPILYPVYYDWPDDHAAYAAQRGEYVLGGELLVAPITTPMEKTGLASAEVWLPEGKWVEFTSGRRYPGSQKLRAYRGLSEVPVFVRPGTVIPMDGAEHFANGCPLPGILLFKAFGGASGGCHVIEDNGKARNSADYRQVETRCLIEERDSTTVMISPPIGEASLLPEHRRYVVELVGVENRLPDEATCAYEASYDPHTRTLSLTLDAKALTGATLRWHGPLACPPLDRLALLREALLPLRMNNDDKDRIMAIAARCESGVRRVAAWRCLNLPDSVMGMLEELELLA